MCVIQNQCDYQPRELLTVQRKVMTLQGMYGFRRNEGDFDVLGFLLELS